MGSLECVLFGGNTYLGYENPVSTERLKPYWYFIDATRFYVPTGSGKLCNELH